MSYKLGRPQTGGYYVPQPDLGGGVIIFQTTPYNDTYYQQIHNPNLDLPSLPVLTNLSPQVAQQIIQNWNNQQNGDTPIIITTGNNTVQNQGFPTNSSSVACNCLHGTPYITASGECGCRTSTDTVDGTTTTPPIKVIDTKNGQPVIYTTNAPVDNGSDLFGTLKQKLQENPTVALVGAGILAYLIFKGK